MKNIQFSELHKSLADAVLQREGKDFMPDVVECRIIDQNEYDENLNVTGKNKVVEVYYGCGDFRGSIAPVKVTKTLETWFANVIE
jgi:hypothetical protein